MTIDKSPSRQHWLDRLLAPLARFMSHDVFLPCDQPPRFPERCVVCGARHTTTTVTIRSWPSGRNGVRAWILGRGPRVDIPACPDHGRWLRRKSTWRILTPVLLTPVFIVAALVINHVWLNGEFGQYGLIAATVVPVVLFPLHSVFNPIPFECQRRFNADANKDQMAYEFKNRDYAVEFAELNGTVVDDLGVPDRSG